jgi:hypothetical protein
VQRVDIESADGHISRTDRHDLMTPGISDSLTGQLILAIDNDNITGVRQDDGLPYEIGYLGY